uniref:Uncharacterized protein n=1 Tax=Rhizophora mucronata TaxID=61149 RepID=A0A2P2JVB5_RHIMU
MSMLLRFDSLSFESSRFFQISSFFFPCR